MSTDFPVKSKQQFSSKAEASILVHSYSNRLFIVLSEADCGRGTGTLVEFRKEEFSGELSIGDQESSVYDIKVIFGAETPEILLSARVLGSKIHLSGCTDKPILFGIGLKKFGKPRLEEIGSELIQILKQL